MSDADYFLSPPHEMAMMMLAAPREPNMLKNFFANARLAPADANANTIEFSR